MMTAWNDKDDHALLAAIASGSHHAFAALVSRHTAIFYRLAFRYMAERGAAEDVVQDAFLKLWERPHLWNPAKHTKFTTWFYRVIINACLDRQKKKAPAILAELPEQADHAMMQDVALMQKQRQQCVERAIHHLPPRQRHAINLCVYEELSNKEAADILNIRVKALESLLSRARKNLKSSLQEADTHRSSTMEAS